MEEKEKMDLESAKTWSDAEKLIAERLLESNDSLARSAIEQANRNVKKWFIIAIISIAALVATNSCWLYVFQSYEYVSQDGNGVNNINSGTQGDLLNGAESED